MKYSLFPTESADGKFSVDYKMVNLDVLKVYSLEKFFRR